MNRRQHDRSRRQERGAFRITLALSTAIAAALLFAVVAIAVQDRDRVLTALADGGDFDLDLAAAAPGTYTQHGPGEGNETSPSSLQYDGGVSNTFVRESLEVGDYQCEDRIVFYTRVKVKNTATGIQTIDLNYVFDAEPSGQPGAGYSDIIAVDISNSGVFAPTQTSETGNINLDGNETAILVPGSERFVPVNTVFGTAEELLGTVRVTGLEANDQLIVRVDVRFSCYGGGILNVTGNVHGAIGSADEVTNPADPD